MKTLIYIVALLFVVSCSSNKHKINQQTLSVYSISNQQSVELIDLSFIVDENNNPVRISELDFKFEALSGKEIVRSIKISQQSNLEIVTKKLGIANYRLEVSSKKKQIEPVNINIEIASQFLLDFTQSNPFEPRGSIQGIPYPDNSLVQVSNEIIGVDIEGKSFMLSPGLLVHKKVAAIPHNSQQTFPDFDDAIKYYAYKENDGEFSFRYQPLIPMLEVGNGNKNRGVGIIVINKDQIMNNPKITYEFEGYCSIRTRTDAKKTYNLGVVIGTINKEKATLKDAIVARDYFNIGYSSSGQIFSNKFSLDNDDYLTINIVGEAGLGGDKKRTTRFEYILISPVLNN